MEDSTELRLEIDTIHSHLEKSSGDAFIAEHPVQFETNIWNAVMVCQRSNTGFLSSNSAQTCKITHTKYELIYCRLNVI